MKKVNKIEKGLNDSSWLAQIIKQRMDVEFNTKGDTTRFNCLNTLHAIVNQADDKNNDDIFYDKIGGNNAIVIADIPSLVEKEGLDFDKHGMQSKLRGLAENYKYDDGNYIVSVNTTLGLNSAIIKDISALMFELNW